MASSLLARALSGAKLSSKSGARTSFSTPAHRVEEVRVVLGCADLVNQKLRRLEVVHGVEKLSQHPHLLQDLFFDQQLFAAGAGAVDVDRRKDALLVHAPVEVNFHVARALELLLDHVVPAPARVDQKRGEDGEGAAFLHASCWPQKT